MGPRKPLSKLTVTELQARTAEYWRMSEEARTADMRDALARLAVRFEELAQRRSPAG